MNRQLGVRTVGTIGAIVIVLTVAGFILLGFDRNAVNGWALFFLLASEVALFAGTASIQNALPEGGSGLFLQVGVSSALSLYFAVTLVFVFTAPAFDGHVGGFVFVGLAIAAIFGIILVALCAWSRGGGDRDRSDISQIGANDARRGGF